MENEIKQTIEIIEENDIGEEENAKYDLAYEFKISYRYFRKQLSSFIRKRLKKDFTTILYITEPNYSKDFIISLMRQYPDKRIKILIPLFDEVKGFKKVYHSFDFYLQNKKFSAQIYQLPKDNNIDILGIFSEAFSSKEGSENFRTIKYLSPFMKSVRIASKIIKPDMIHSNNLPFFLGAEFESCIYPISVFQQINDFSELPPIEPFWAILNIVDKKGLKKLCKDKIIQKYISCLFRQRKIRNQNTILECIDLMYSNYIDFQNKVSSDDIDGKSIFQALNLRALKLFPNIICKENLNYLPWYYTIKRSDYWAVISKTYYQNLYSNPELSYGMFDRIENTKYKSGYVSIGYNNGNNKIRYPFDLNNFRETRKLNKEYLQKELSEERIKTKFIDSRLFNTPEYKIEGYIDPFFKAPLLFIKFNEQNSYEEKKLAIWSILKLFELNRSVHIIINYDGVNIDEYLQAFIDFCIGNPMCNGRWIFIQGKLNLPQFLSASDMILLPTLKNPTDSILFEAVKQGCVPVVTKNGIYNDKVSEILDDMTAGCGFKTNENIDVTSKGTEEIFSNTINKALNFYTQNSSSWNLLIKNTLNYDTSWNFKTIEKYNKIYEELV